MKRTPETREAQLLNEFQDVFGCDSVVFMPIKIKVADGCRPRQRASLGTAYFDFRHAQPDNR
ncbi:MAG: hypothetical protein ACJ74Y_10860 [Bryobacteraceae bacterium]